VNLIIAEGDSRGRESWLPHEYVVSGYNLLKLAPQLLNSDIYVCGPNNWSDLVVKEAVRSGVSQHQIHWERFNW
jgi:ferredoxin-NADP reductase